MIRDMKVKTERTIFIELDEPRIEDHFYNGKRIAITSIKLIKLNDHKIETADVQGTFVKTDGTIGKGHATSLYVSRRIMPAWLLGIVEDVDRFIQPPDEDQRHDFVRQEIAHRDGYRVGEAARVAADAAYHEALGDEPAVSHFDEPEFQVEDAS